MTLRESRPTMLILEHRPCRNLLTVFVSIALCLAFGTRAGPIGALLASGLSAWLAWRGARHFEDLRVVFDAKAARVDIHRRTGRHGATVIACALGEIGSVEARVTASSRTSTFQLALPIPEGPHAGQHPLNLFPIVGGDGPDPVLAAKSWRSKN